MALATPAGSASAQATVWGDLVTAFSRRSTLDFNRMSMLRRFADDRSSEVNAAHQVLITDPVPTDHTEQDSTYGMMAKGSGKGQRTPDYARNDDDWEDGREVESKFLVLAVDQTVQNGADLKYLDMVEAPLNYLERQRAKMAAVMATDLEDDYYGFLDGISYGEVTASTTKKRAFANREHPLGAATTTFINEDGKVTEATAGKMGEAIYDGIMDFNTYLVNQNVLGPTAGATIGGSAGTPYVAMNPEVFQIFIKYFLEKRLSWDQLTESILSRNSLLGGEAYRGQIAGVPIYVTPAITKPAAGGTWKIQAGTTMANAVAMRPPLTQFLTPETNQEKYRYKMRQVAFHGRIEVNPALNYRMTIPTA